MLLMAKGRSEDYINLIPLKDPFPKKIQDLLFLGFGWSQSEIERGRDVFINPFTKKPIRNVFGFSKTGKIGEEVFRVLFNHFGIPTWADISSLKGIECENLFCHSNGCQIALELISKGYIKAKHLYLMGADVHINTAKQLVKAKGVESIDVFINKNDKFVARIFGSFIIGNLKLRDTGEVFRLEFGKSSLKYQRHNFNIGSHTIKDYNENMSKMENPPIYSSPTSDIYAPIWSADEDSPEEVVDRMADMTKNILSQLPENSRVVLIVGKGKLAEELELKIKELGYKVLRKFNSILKDEIQEIASETGAIICLKINEKRKGSSEEKYEVKPNIDFPEKKKLDLDNSYTDDPPNICPDGGQPPCLDYIPVPAKPIILPPPQPIINPNLAPKPVINPSWKDWVNKVRERLEKNNLGGVDMDIKPEGERKDLSKEKEKILKNKKKDDVFWKIEKEKE